MCDRRLLAILLPTLLAVPAGAQMLPGDQGMYLRTQSGGGGSLCRGFTCTPYPVAVAANEMVTLEVRGPPSAPFWVFGAPAAPLCMLVPGLMHSLILAPPIVPLAGGTLGLGDPILSCPGGLQKLSFPIPLPPTATFALQGLVLALWQNGPLPTFTPAITVVVK